MPSLKKDLDRAEAIRLQFGAEFERERYTLFKRLDAATFRTPKDLKRFHELVVFARAWPDSPRVLGLARKIAKAFAERDDLQPHRERLLGSGIAGTDIEYSFYLPTANWLGQSFPQHLDIDWDVFDADDELDTLLKHAALFAEQQGLNSYGYKGKDRLKKMRGQDTTADGAFLLSLLELLAMDPRIKEQYYDNLAMPFVLRPGPGTPSRTTLDARPQTIHYHTRPLKSQAMDLKQAAKQRLPETRVTGTKAKKLIALARGVMVTTFRDIDPIAYADPDDIRIVDAGEGLQIVMLGVIPERRFLLECEYGHLILKNGVPVGYGSAWSLYGSCSLNFNIFPSFRGGQGVEIFASTVAAYRQLFDADTFVAEPYQLGEDNEEAIQSGAWWFYNKLGYVPHDKNTQKLANAEINKRRTRKNYRSSPATLRRLADSSMFFPLERTRKDVLGLIELEAVGLAVTDYLAKTYGANRQRAEAGCEKQVCELLDIDRNPLSTGQRLWLRQWSPLIASLKSVSEWPANDRTALRAVLLAKGGPDQSRYVQLFDRHKKLRDAILQLSHRALKNLD